MTDGDANPQLAYGGVCPVCGDEFVDPNENLESGESYRAKMCVVESIEDGDGEGQSLIHLPDVEANDD